MHRRALLRRVGAASALGAVGTASAHPGDGGSRGTETGPSGTGIGPHSKLRLDEAREAVVGPSGTVVYVATMDGFATVDVADPHDPTILAEVEAVLPDHDDGPLEGIQDLKVDGDRLLVVGAASRGFDFNAAVVYDVADPAAPEMVGAHETDYSLHNAYLEDGVAYLPANGAPGNPLVTVAVGSEGDADAFAELGRWSLFDHDEAWESVDTNLRTLHDVWVQDDLAYLAYWDAGTWILDVSDPENPSFVSRVRGREPADLPSEPRYAVVRESTVPPGNDHYVTTNEDGTLLGIGSESWAFQGSGGPSGIAFYDVSDPAEPTELGTIEPPESDDPSRAGVWTTAHNFQLIDDYCYSSWYQGGVKIHDVSDPADPVQEYHWRESDAARFWAAELAVEGQSFVAPSIGVPGAEGGTDSGDDGGTGDGTDDGTGDGTDDGTGDGTDDGTGDGTDGGTATGDEEGQPALYVFPDVVHEGPEATPTQREGASSAFGPGFGVGAAVAGVLGLGAWWASRSESGE